MQRRFVGLLLFVPVLTFAAAAPEGRWEGAVHIPGRELPLVVDLAPGSAGAWTGSLIMQGVGVTRSPLANIAVGESSIAFDAGTLLRGPNDGPATFKAQIVSPDTMAGEFSQGGNVAKFSLKRTAPAQVESFARSTAVRREIEAEWTGEFELGGYPRHLTIALENHAGGAATSKFVIVGKRTTDLPVDLVVDEGDFVRVESQATRVAFEGRYVREASEIRGTIDLGYAELPVVLHRAARKAQ